MATLGRFSVSTTKEIAMMLLTKAIRKRIPALYSQEKKGMEAKVHVKFFNPCGAATWFATEFDPETGRFFGYVSMHLGEGELGYFMLHELEGVRLPFGLGIERDRHFEPKPLREAIEELHAMQGV
jgi:hypothetical protein